MVTLLHLEFDLNKLTKARIEMFQPRMPKCVIIAFDEWTMEQRLAETGSLLDSLGIANVKIERFRQQAQLRLQFSSDRPREVHRGLVN